MTHLGLSSTPSTTRAAIVLTLVFLWSLTADVAGTARTITGSKPIRFQRGDVRPSELRRDSEARFVLVQFRRAVGEQAHRQLEARGVKLLAYVPHNSYWARLGDDVRSLDTLEAGGGITGWGSPPNEMKLSIGLTGEQLSSEERFSVNLTLFPGASVEETRQEIRGIDPAAELQRFSRGVFRAGLRGLDLPAIADLQAVQWIEPAIESFTLDNAESAALLDIPMLHQDPPGLSGSSVNVAVFDACYPDLEPTWLEAWRVAASMIPPQRAWLQRRTSTPIPLLFIITTILSLTLPIWPLA
jgi:hypothetical protein